MKGLEKISYEEGVSDLGLFRWRSFRGDLVTPYNHLKGGCSELGSGLTSTVPAVRKPEEMA